MRKDIDHALGFSFIETFVSLFILSFVFLGWDAMQIANLRATQNNHYFYLASLELDQISLQLFLLNRKNQDTYAAISNWNKQNALVLPKGKGWVFGHYPKLDLIVAWGGLDEKACKKSQFNVSSGCIRRIFTD